MSVYISNKVLLGFYLPDQLLQTTTHYRGCSHDEAPVAKFCPECGAPMWKEDHERLRELDSEQFTLKEVNTSDFSYEGNKGAVLGLVLEVDKESGAFTPPPVDEWQAIEDDLRAVLQSYGITPPGKFGLHLARYVS